MRSRNAWLFGIALSLVAIVLSITAIAKAHGGWNRGEASWYGPGLYGNTMGCGGKLTRSTWAVAHKSYRCGTRLQICYRRCVLVRVKDRGPFVGARVLDLTHPVKVAIGFPSVGTVRYRVR